VFCNPAKGAPITWENLSRPPPLRHIWCHAACLARKRARAFFPSLAASAMPSKKPGEHSTNPERPARWISHRQGFAGLPRLFTTNE
jgi:hypothetical protein